MECSLSMALKGPTFKIKRGKKRIQNVMQTQNSNYSKK